MLPKERNAEREATFKDDTTFEFKWCLAKAINLSSIRSDSSSGWYDRPLYYLRATRCCTCWQRICCLQTVKIRRGCSLLAQRNARYVLHGLSLILVISHYDNQSKTTTNHVFYIQNKRVCTSLVSILVILSKTLMKTQILEHGLEID